MMMRDTRVRYEPAGGMSSSRDLTSKYRRARPICVRHPGTRLAADTGHAQAKALSPGTGRVVIGCAARSAYVTDDPLVAARPSVAEGVLVGQKLQNRPGRFEGCGQPGPFAQGWAAASRGTLYSMLSDPQ